MSSVDVIVPCYNYGDYLRECVESVLSQDGVDVRVLIIDDCSSDNTPEVGGQLQIEDERVVFRRHATNQGHIATYNEGLDWVSADYTVLISADDLLLPGALRRICGFLDANPEVGFAYGKAIRWKSNEPKPGYDVDATEVQTQVIRGVEWIERICTGDPPTTSPEVIVRTCLQKEIGQYRAELPHWADVELLMRFAAHAPVGYIDSPQAYYRQHESNMNRSYRGIRDLEQRRIAFLSVFHLHGHLIQNSEALKTVALSRIAESACWKASDAFNQGDLTACMSYLRFAQSTYPPICASYLVLRLRMKMVIGRRVCGLLRSIWRAFRPRVRRNLSQSSGLSRQASVLEYVG